MSQQCAFYTVKYSSFLKFLTFQESIVLSFMKPMLHPMVRRNVYQCLYSLYLEDLCGVVQYFIYQDTI